MVGSTYDGSAGGQSTPGPPVVHGPRSSSEKHNEPQRTNTSHEHPHCGHRCVAELLRADHRRHIPIGQYELHWLELIGVSIGIASAWLGMKRLVWAWPVGIIANIMLFFVYVGAAFGLEEQRSPCSASPAGRSSSSSSASTAGSGGRSTDGRWAPPATPRRSCRAGCASANGSSWSSAGWSAPSSSTRSSWPCGRPRRTRSSRRSGGSTGATRGSSSARSSRPTRWRAAGTSSGWPGSPSTWSASRSASPPATCRPP